MGFLVIPVMDLCFLSEFLGQRCVFCQFSVKKVMFSLSQQSRIFAFLLPQSKKFAFDPLVAVSNICLVSDTSYRHSKGQSSSCTCSEDQFFSFRPLTGHLFSCCHDDINPSSASLKKIHDLWTALVFITAHPGWHPDPSLSPCHVRGAVERNVHQFFSTIRRMWDQLWAIQSFNYAENYFIMLSQCRMLSIWPDLCNAKSDEVTSRGLFHFRLQAAWKSMTDMASWSHGAWQSVEASQCNANLTEIDARRDSLSPKQPSILITSSHCMPVWWIIREAGAISGTGNLLSFHLHTVHLHPIVKICTVSILINALLKEIYINNASIFFRGNLQASDALQSHGHYVCRIRWEERSKDLTHPHSSLLFFSALRTALTSVRELLNWLIRTRACLCICRATTRQGLCQTFKNLRYRNNCRTNSKLQSFALSQVDDSAPPSGRCSVLCRDSRIVLRNVWRWRYACCAMIWRVCFAVVECRAVQELENSVPPQTCSPSAPWRPDRSFRPSLPALAEYASHLALNSHTNLRKSTILSCTAFGTQDCLPVCQRVRFYDTWNTLPCACSSNWEMHGTRNTKLCVYVSACELRGTQTWHCVLVNQLKSRMIIRTQYCMHVYPFSSRKTLRALSACVSARVLRTIHRKLFASKSWRKVAHCWSDHWACVTTRLLSWQTHTPI